MATQINNTFSDSHVTKIENARYLRDHRIIYNDVLYIQGGKIIDPQKHFYDFKEQPITVVDAKGALISPGFIDVQVNGAFGVDFTELSNEDDPHRCQENLDRVAKGLVQYGCTSFLPTIISSPPEVYRKVLPLLKPRKTSGAEILGAHIEGPFISFERNGAHDKSHLRNGSWSEVSKVYGISENVTHESIRLCTLAPEVVEHGCIKKLTNAGITVSIGHSMATVEVAEDAVLQGAKCLTHLFNAMPNFHHRNPGLIGVLGSTRIERPFYGIICDGIHTHPSSVAIAHMSLKKAVLITDAVSSLGLPSGEYKLGGIPVVKFGSRVELKEGKGTLAGACCPIDQCVRNFRRFVAEIPSYSNASSDAEIVETLEAATLHPAQMLGIQDRKGTLNYGSDADLVFLDDDFNVLKCFVAGKLVYETEESHTI